MKLTAITKTLQYYINDESQGIAFRGIELSSQQFKMAVCLSAVQDAVELTSFQLVRP